LNTVDLTFKKQRVAEHETHISCLKNGENNLAQGNVNSVNNIITLNN